MRNTLENDLLYIEIMLERFLNSVEYLAHFILSEFELTDEMFLETLAFQLVQAVERIAKNKLSQELKENFSLINWRKIERNMKLLSYEYYKENINKVIEIGKVEIPIYIKQLYKNRDNLLNELDEG